MWCVILTRKAVLFTPGCLFVFSQIWTIVCRRGPFPKENIFWSKVLIHSLHWKFQYRFGISIVRTQTSSPMAACIPPRNNYNPISENLSGKSSGKKLSASSNSMKLWAVPCRTTKMDGSWWTVMTKCGHLEKGMSNYFSIIALRTPWTIWKGKKTGRWKMSSPGR